MAHVKFDIPMPTDVDVDREAVAYAVIDEIVERTQNRSRNKDGRKFSNYSKAYIKSLDFELAGKSKKVNLTMTGDMLAALDLLEADDKKITIGYEKNSDENDKAEGNIKGTYGDEGRKRKTPRNFLGISNKALARIIAENSDMSTYKAYDFVRENYDNKQSEKL